MEVVPIIMVSPQVSNPIRESQNNAKNSLYDDATKFQTL